MITGKTTYRDPRGFVSELMIEGEEGKEPPERAGEPAELVAEWKADMGEDLPDWWAHSHRLREEIEEIREGVIMPRYRVTNRITHEAYEVEAPFAQDACTTLGWLIGNCHVQLLREGPATRFEPPRQINRATLLAWARREMDRQMADCEPTDPDEELPF